MKLDTPDLGRKKMVAVTGIYVLIILLLSFLIKSQGMSLRQVSKELVEAKAMLDDARRLVANREKYGKEINLLEEQIKFYEDKLPERKEVPQLFKQLDKVAAESQVKFISFEEASSEKGKHYLRFYWKLELEGGYHELGRFINKLENMDRFIKVDSIQIRSNPKNFLKHNIKLELSTFVIQEMKGQKTDNRRQITDSR